MLCKFKIIIFSKNFAYYCCFVIKFLDEKCKMWYDIEARGSDITGGNVGVGQAAKIMAQKAGGRS